MDHYSIAILLAVAQMTQLEVIAKKKTQQLPSAHHPKELLARTPMAMMTGRQRAKVQPKLPRMTSAIRSNLEPHVEPTTFAS